MSVPERPTPPILADKHHDAPSAFTPESLLREARRQKGAEAVSVLRVCLLDPDGDIVRVLRAEGRARWHEGWVCYHTDMWIFDLDGYEICVVGCAVGASFAVLVSEAMFASGCALPVSVTSSGRIASQGIRSHGENCGRAASSRKVPHYHGAHMANAAQRTSNRFGAAAMQRLTVWPRSDVSRL
jgi:hypothetical protein